MEEQKLQIALENWQKMLARLQEKGYVEKNEKGGWRVFITPSV